MSEKVCDLNAGAAPRSRRGAKGGSEPAKREPGYGRLQQLLRDDILEGRLPAGSRLKVNDIAARYGTSTNPAREALQGLDGEGLVKIEPNRGARVRSIDADFVQNIFDIRELIEPYLMRHYVEYATPQDIEALREIQERCQAGVDAGDYLTFHLSNVQFHGHISDLHHNELALRVMKQHNSWIQALSRKNPLSLAHMRQSSAEHWRIIAAVERGNVDEAIQVIRQHMARSREVFLANLRREKRRNEAAPAA